MKELKGKPDNEHEQERPEAVRLGRPLGPKERARVGRLLHSRGFSEDVIQRLLGEPALDPSGLDD